MLPLRKERTACGRIREELLTTTSRSRPPRGAAASLFAAACLALASCGGRAAPTAYPYLADRPRVLFATSRGLSIERQSAAGAAAALAPNASILSADGRSIVAAVNGFGYARIEAEHIDAAAAKMSRGRSRPGSAEKGVAYRVVNVPLRDVMEGLTTAGIWPIGGGFILQLYRDPFTDAPLGAAIAGGAVAPSGAAGARILEIGAIEGERVVDCPLASDGFELFALFPSLGADGSMCWLGELRRDAKDSVELRFFEADSLVATARSVGRGVFESALSPKSIYSPQGLEGAALRSAVAALGQGPFLVRFRSIEGLDSWYLSAGRADEAAQAWAWGLGFGRVIALSATGRLADAGARATRTMELGLPAKGASYTALAAASGLVAAAWETGSFPAIEAAGLVIAPLDR